jgi:hypothetical protein
MTRLRRHLYRIQACAALLGVLAPCAAVHAQTQAGVTATLELAPREVYRHQTFTMTLKVRSARVSLSRRLDLRGLPDTAVVERLTPFRERPIVREQIDGHIVELREYQCEARALEVGEFSFTPTLAVTLVQRRPALIGSFEEHVAREVALGTCRLTARPLPPPPEGAAFSGIVGSVSFDVTPTPTALAVGDILTLKMRLAGKGYFSAVRPPRASPERHFRTYEPRLVEQGDDGLVFEQTLVPQSTNAVAVPAVALCYFDPHAGSYRTLVRGPFPLQFHAAAQTTFTQFRPAESNAADVALDVPAATNRNARAQAALHWLNGDRQTARLAQDHPAYLAPATTALQTFALQRGATVTILARRGDWARVESAGKRGWILIPE